MDRRASIFFFLSFYPVFRNRILQANQPAGATSIIYSCWTGNLNKTQHQPPDTGSVEWKQERCSPMSLADCSCCLRQMKSTACCSCLESKKKESLFIYLSSSILEDSIAARWAWFSIAAL